MHCLYQYKRASGHVFVLLGAPILPFTKIKIFDIGIVPTVCDNFVFHFIQYYSMIHWCVYLSESFNKLSMNLTIHNHQLDRIYIKL